MQSEQLQETENKINEKEKGKQFSKYQKRTTHYQEALEAAGVHGYCQVAAQYWYSPELL